MTSLDLTSVISAKMVLGRFTMALFANDEEKRIEQGAEDGAKIAQAEQVAKILNIPLEDALPKIGKERLPDGVEPFMKLKKGLLPQGFMADENKDAIDIQAATRIIMMIKGGLEPEAVYDPKIFPDSTDAQRHFKGVLARRLEGIEPVKDFSTDDASALTFAWGVVQKMLTKYSTANTVRPQAVKSLWDFASFAESLLKEDGPKSGPSGNGPAPKL